jgi:hypothetical protein
MFKRAALFLAVGVWVIVGCSTCSGVDNQGPSEQQCGLDR